MRGVKRALVVVDMPFGSYQADPFDGVRNAIRIMKETGAGCFETGRWRRSNRRYS